MTDTIRTSRLLFSFAQCLRHAFFSGVGYGDSERISAEDQARWTAYDPPKVGSFASIEAALHENESLRARAEKAEAVCQNFEVKGPDADGLYWLVLHGKGTGGMGAFNLGTAAKIATQVAMHLEEDRRAALNAALEG